MEYIPRAYSRRTPDRVHAEWSESLAHVRQGGNISITGAGGNEIARLLAPASRGEGEGSASIRLDTPEQVEAVLRMRGPGGEPLAVDRGGRRVELLDLDAFREPRGDNRPATLATSVRSEQDGLREADPVLCVDHPEGWREYLVEINDPVLLSMTDAVLDAIPEDLHLADVDTEPRFTAMMQMIGTYMVASSHRGLREYAGNPAASARTAVRRAELQAYRQWSRNT